MTYLPDVNIWLALTFRAHAHHALTNDWFRALPPTDGLCFCRMTQQGFLRLATHPTAGGVTLRDAWVLYDRIFEDPRLHFAVEPYGLEQHWRALTQSPAFSPKVWNDAYLAAFATAGEFALVTLDGGFSQYRLKHCTILTR